MGRTRDTIEKLLFPGAHGQRRRHMRFFLLAVLLGLMFAMAVAVIFFFMDTRVKPKL